MPISQNHIQKEKKIKPTKAIKITLLGTQNVT